MVTYGNFNPKILLYIILSLLFLLKIKDERKQIAMFSKLRTPDPYEFIGWKVFTNGLPTFLYFILEADSAPEEDCRFITQHGKISITRVD